MARVQLVVDGPPQPCERARRGPQGHWYTPTATRDYKQRVAWAWRAAQHATFGATPLTISARFHIERPPSHLRKNGTVRDRHTTMIPPGDLDNYLKGLLDGLQDAGAFHNDTQIICLAGIHKHWAPPRHARTELDLWPAQ